MIFVVIGIVLIFGTLLAGIAGATVGYRQSRREVRRHSHQCVGNPTLRIWHSHPGVEHADTDNEILNVAPFRIQ